MKNIEPLEKELDDIFWNAKYPDRVRITVEIKKYVWFRPVRSTLQESMESKRQVSGKGELFEWLSKIYLFMDFDINSVEVEWYGHDDRIDWPAYIVTINGDAVGFLSGELSE